MTAGTLDSMLGLADALPPTKAMSMLRALVLALLIFGVYFTATAQDEQEAVADSVVSLEGSALEAQGDSLASVMLGGRELFRVSAQSVISAQERADGISAAILEFAESYRRRPRDLRAVRDPRI